MLAITYLLILLGLCISNLESLRINFSPSISQIRYHRRISLQETATTDHASSSISSSTSSRAPILPEGTHYCQCGFCKTAYVLPKSLIEKERGTRVKCSVCQKEWYQSFDRLPVTNRVNLLTNLSEEKIQEVRRIINDTNVPKYPRLDRIELFIGNIPYSYNEINLAELFAEYGVLSTHIVRDVEQHSKGFGFIEVAFLEDAKQAIQEMSDFPVENRRLTVKLAEDGKRTKAPPTQSNVV